MDDDNVLEVRIVGMPDSLGLEIRNQLIMLSLGAIVTGISAVITESLIARAKRRRQLKAAQEIVSENKLVALE